MALSQTSLCNMALSRIGAARIADYNDASDSKKEAIQCRLHFEQTARALTQSHLWRFAKARAQLSQDTDSPAFQWTYSYELPTLFLRPLLIYDGSDLPDGRTYYSYELEGTKLLIDESTVYLKYIQWVETVSKWDPLFAETFILVLANKLVIPLGRDLKVKEGIEKELGPLMRRVRAMDRQEQMRIGRAERKTWREAQYSDIA